MDKKVFLIDKEVYKESDVIRFTEDDLENFILETTVNIVSNDNDYSDSPIIKLDANQYATPEDAIDGEGFDPDSYYVLAFGFSLKGMIKFDINKKPEILSGKYRVVTRNNNPVRIIAWDRKGVFSIIGLVLLKHDDVELLREFRSDGSNHITKGRKSDDDLFLIENK